MEERQIRKLKLLLIGSSLVCLAFLVAAAWEENVATSWRKHQADYARLLAAGATDLPAATHTVEMRQNYLPGLNRIDRCVACHAGIDNTAATDYPEPLRAHPGDILVHHPPDKFGCTICHPGQGRATVLPNAHGETPHWPEPLLSRDLTYTSCGRCHYENDLYAGQSDLYGQVRPVEYVTSGELTSSVPGAETIARGKRLVIEHGCLGCHKYRGRGGTLGPDITHIGDKTVHDFDFKHAEGDHTVLNWMHTHFKSPTAVVPESLMPDMDLSDKEASDLAAYMISLKRKSAPAEYTPLPRPLDRTPAEGRTLYAMYCSSCHGADGIGVSLQSASFLAVASDEFLRDAIIHGRPNTAMPAWHHLSADDVVDLIRFLRTFNDGKRRKLEPLLARGDWDRGRIIFHGACAGCHGVWAEGGVGLQLANPTFLDTVTDEMLLEWISYGKLDTAMKPFLRGEQGVVELSESQIGDVVTWLRYNQDRPRAVTARPGVGIVPHGAETYAGVCSGCHGKQGEDLVGSALANPTFLRSASDGYLAATIVMGRDDTEMRSMASGMQGIVEFDADDVADVVALLRSWEREPPTPGIPPRYVAGADPTSGQELYVAFCAGCHGREGKDGWAPELDNREFLTAATDGFLQATIARGRSGTAMRSFGKGGGGLAPLTTNQIDDLVTYIRNWTRKPGEKQARRQASR